MPNEIKNQNEQLSQVNHLASQIFENSSKIIDERFGQNYARKNPNLLASVVSLQEKLFAHQNKTA
jgi:hypothetical protein